MNILVRAAGTVLGAVADLFYEVVDLTERRLNDPFDAQCPDCGRWTHEEPDPLARPCDWCFDVVVPRTVRERIMLAAFRRWERGQQPHLD